MSGSAGIKRCRLGRGIKAAALVMALWLGLPQAAALAKIYKYQQNGVWHYTDNPEELPADTQEMVESDKTAATNGPARQLKLDLAPKNEIEQVVAGTVAIQSALGYGSGFFISAQGHILTNKHVVRTVRSQADRQTAAFNQATERITYYQSRLDEEKRRMEAYARRLARLKTVAEAETEPYRKKAYQADYQEGSATLKRWRADFDQRLNKFQAEKDRFEAGRRDYEYDQSVGNLASSFTVILADNKKMYARLVSVSERHDLALLKIDGYATPHLSAGSAATLPQGEPVYAVGNPIRLQNSVTSGVFSGFEQGFIQTNAQIYPGNSGGPLVLKDGRVIGINTFKKITRKFEGLGFAIPIQTALTEFSGYLPSP